MRSARRLHLRHAFPAAACLVAGVGCRGPGFDVAAVDGTVTVDGKPAAGLMIEFAPVRRDDVQPPLSYGLTDARGAYTARDRRGNPGVVVGAVRVTFSTVEGAPPIAPGRIFGTEVLDREVKPGSTTLDFHLESQPSEP